ncbi:hypothetical protein ACHAQA_007055 [Verticillium albo-atrum]
MEYQSNSPVSQAFRPSTYDTPPGSGGSPGTQTSSTCPTVLREGAKAVLHQYRYLRSPDLLRSSPTPHSSSFGIFATPDDLLGHRQSSRQPQAADQLPLYQLASFRPSNAIVGSITPPQDPFEVAYIKARHGISAKYRGDPRLPGNHSAKIPDAENCSFWIVNLPPDVTHRELLGCIRNTGRIHACVINPPDPRNNHFTAAAKVVFFDLPAAERFLRSAYQGLIVGKYRARVNRNRIKSAAQPHATDQTRVLIIQGRPDFVNPQVLTRYFDSKFQYQIDHIIDAFRSPEVAIVEYRFGSYRCQAQTARMAIETEHMRGVGGSGYVYDMWYGRDPCDIFEEAQTRF